MKTMKYSKVAENESKILQSLDNPYIVKYYDSFRDGNEFNIVMEYAENGDLRQKIINQSGKPFPEKFVLHTFNGICKGIQYVHDKNILHRDLKPGNIFLQSGDGVLVGDFGIAKQLKNNSNWHRDFYGT